MKEIKILIGDYEYAEIEEIFKKEENFEPITEKDNIIVKALKAIISPKNLVAEDVGGVETYSTTVKKLKEPANRSLEEGEVEFKI